MVVASSVVAGEREEEEEKKKKKKNVVHLSILVESTQAVLASCLLFLPIRIEPVIVVSHPMRPRASG
jgi:hypothetical protein